MTDREWLLELLSDGQPHSLNEILRRSFAERGCGLTVHSRAADLRAAGHPVANFTVAGLKRGDGSVYQLVAGGEGREGPELATRSPLEAPSSSPPPAAPLASAAAASPATNGAQLELIDPAPVRARPAWA